MKRITIVGLCLLTAGAFAALAGASSAAAAPEWGVCVSAKKAVYENSSCTKVAEKKGKPDGKGHFEWHGAGECYATRKGEYTESLCKDHSEKKGNPAHKGSFELAPSPKYTSTTAEATLKSALGNIACASSVDEGAIKSKTTDTDSIRFFGCTALGQTCLNTVVEGKPSIATEVLPSTLGEEGGKVTNTFGDGPSGYSAVFACENVGYFRTSGPTCGTVSPLDEMETSTTITFEEGSGCQKLVSEYSSSPSFTEPLVAPAEEIMVGHDTSSTAFETR